MSEQNYLFLKNYVSLEIIINRSPLLVPSISCLRIRCTYMHVHRFDIISVVFFLQRNKLAFLLVSYFFPRECEHYNRMSLHRQVKLSILFWRTRHTTYPEFWQFCFNPWRCIQAFGEHIIVKPPRFNNFQQFWEMPFNVKAAAAQVLISMWCDVMSETFFKASTCQKQDHY